VRKYERQGEDKELMCGFLGNNMQYVLGSDLGQVIMWDKEDGSCVGKFDSGTEWIRGIVPSTKNVMRFITYSYDGTLVE
jgi:hypothetical protein